MKIGDLIRHKHGNVALVLYVNIDGGTIKTFGPDGERWLVTSECEVINEI
tara:strand:- start:5584 stop:5733 length:150 start_codon:yes stop_codon:yes gene_type:complete